MRKILCETCPRRTEGGICDLPSDAMEDFRAAGVSAVYKARQVVFSEGSPTDGLYLVCHGSVKVYHSDRFGRDHILEVVGPGALLGELPSGGNQELSVSAEALTEAQICFLPRERLDRFLERHPGVAMRLIMALSDELVAARQKVRDLALKAAESRLAGLLVQMANEQGGMSNGRRVVLNYSRREIAEMIGVSAETAIRLLAKLKRKQAITTQRRELVISDVEKLERIANQGMSGS